MAVVINGVILVDGMPVGKANGVKDGTVLDLSYERPIKVTL